MPGLADISASFVRRSFLRHVIREVAKRGVRVPSRARIIVEAREFASYPAPPASDTAGRSHVGIAALVLATYRELAADIPDSGERIDLLKRALLQAYRTQLRLPFRAALAATRDRFRLLTHTLVSPKVERRFFGPAFSFERRGSGETFELAVHRCLYHRFFTANGAPELTAVICHSDHAWIDELDPAKHGVRFTRPTTLGWGDAECVFRFEREAPGEPPRR